MNINDTTANNGDSISNIEVGLGQQGNSKDSVTIDSVINLNSFSNIYTDINTNRILLKNHNSQFDSAFIIDRKILFFFKKPLFVHKSRVIKEYKDTIIIKQRTNLRLTNVIGDNIFVKVNKNSRFKYCTKLKNWYKFEFVGIVIK